MKKINKEKIISVTAYGFWVAYAGLILASIYGTVYHFKTLKKIKEDVDVILRIERGY